MATHSSVLTWRIPGTAEPGGLPSMGSHRVEHDQSDLAAAATMDQALFQVLCYNEESQKQTIKYRSYIGSKKCYLNNYLENNLLTVQFLELNCLQSQQLCYLGKPQTRLEEYIVYWKLQYKATFRPILKVKASHCYVFEC